MCGIRLGNNTGKNGKFTTKFNQLQPVPMTFGEYRINAVEKKNQKQRQSSASKTPKPKQKSKEV
jgi:hypothetical protein